MRHLERLTTPGLALVALLMPSLASAGILTNATWSQTEFGFALTRTFGQATFSGTSTSTSISVNVVYPFFSTVFGIPKSPNGALDLAVQITQGGSQSIVATATQATANVGVPGTIVVAGGLPLHTTGSMSKIGASTILQIPINVGGTGTHLATFNASGVNHTMSITFYGWSLGSFSFTGLSSGYQPLPDQMAAGSFALNANGGGMVTLVSPSKVSIDGAVAVRRTVSITTLQLSFVPEPGTLLLLGAAAVALGIASRRGRT